MSRRLLSRILAVSAAFATAWAPMPAAAGITTPAVIANTVAAVPSCLSYKVEGICFFLYCSWSGCRIRTSIKISHYVPDVVVSTYNSPQTHPWKDVGVPVSSGLAKAGSTLLGSLSDSSAGGLDTDSAMTVFKGADAIGNPAGRFAELLASGGMFELPRTIAVPNVTELSGFPSELPSIGRAWVNVPSEIVQTVSKDAKAMLDAPTALLNSISTITRSIQGMRQAMEIAQSVQRVNETINGVQQIASMVSGITGGGTLFCPGGASFFNLHFQSELDAPFWRGTLPVELLYPQTWVPGLQEVGAGSAQTWGSVYPRTGEIVQAHPVKASAVLAERVASIIYKSRQPHVYTKVTPNQSGSYRYFNFGEKRKWQMLSPRPSTGCVNFGVNDSLWLTSWGDGDTDSADGYAWNLWQHYTCCRRRGTYLYSIP